MCQSPLGMHTMRRANTMIILADSSRDTTHTLISSHSATHYAFLAARLGPFLPSPTGLSDLTQLAFGFC